MNKWKEDLLIDIRYGDERDDSDLPLKETISVQYDGKNGEFSPCNHEALLKNFLKIKHNCKSILEIGIARGERGSSYTLTKNKNKDCVYVGVDIRDGSFLNDHDNNVFTIQTGSENYEQILSFIKSKGVEKLDFIFIDGWHSINQVYKEWEFTSLLSENGIVGFHDTNNHPGPTLFVKNLNSDWVVEKSCLEDNGITFVWKKQ